MEHIVRDDAEDIYRRRSCGTLYWHGYMYSDYDAIKSNVLRPRVAYEDISYLAYKC